MSVDDDDDTGQQTEGEASADTVARAKEMGWVSPDDWKGGPPKNGFLDPAEFVRRGEKVMPIVRAEAAKLRTELAKERQEREQDKADHRDTIRRIERMTTVALEQQKAQIESKYADRMELAVDTGDKAAYRQADKEKKEALAAIDEKLKDDPDEDLKDKAKKGADLPPKLKATIDEWLDENEWFNKDRKLNAYANAVYADLTEERPGMDERKKLDAVRAEVAKKFPEKFGEVEDEEDDKPRGSRVEGGGRLNGGGGRQSGYAALPKEAKAIADRFIKDDGLFLKPGETVEKNLGQARERYAQQYFGDDKS